MDPEKTVPNVDADEDQVPLSDTLQIMFPGASTVDLDRAIRRRFEIQSRIKEPLAGVVIITVRQQADGLEADCHAIANGSDAYDELLRGLLCAEEELVNKVTR